MAKKDPLACDLLWADPDKDAKSFEPNKIRAISYIFGPNQVDEFCKNNNIDLIIRAHQVVEYGYAFFADRRLITVFSASRYQAELANYAAVVVVSKHLELSFTQLKPEEFEQARDREDNRRGEAEKEQTTANLDK
uniref:SER_THR_PHOSPHATASE domain-containing protein n=1 Tax=Caenorhabditis japonica TaxID=281687 RepID=A0A8R1HTP4_CAEJA